jgi:hypothetical protein
MLAMSKERWEIVDTQFGWPSNNCTTSATTYKCAALRVKAIVHAPKVAPAAYLWAVKTSHGSHFRHRALGQFADTYQAKTASSTIVLIVLLRSTSFS